MGKGVILGSQEGEDEKMALKDLRLSAGLCLRLDPGNHAPRIQYIRGSYYLGLLKRCLVETCKSIAYGRPYRHLRKKDLSMV